MIVRKGKNKVLCGHINASCFVQVATGDQEREYMTEVSGEREKEGEGYMVASDA